MASRDKLRLHPSWWRDRRPDGVGESDFEQALRRAAAALEDVEHDEADALLAEEAADAVDRAAAEARETQRALRSHASRDLLEELEELAAFARKESERLRAAAEAAAEADRASREQPEHRLADPAHLRRMIRLLPHQGPMIFGFAASPEEEECGLFIRPRGNARRLMDLARGLPGDGRPCCGSLFMMRNEPRLLILSLDSTVPSHLARLFRRFLLRIRCRRVKKILVLRDGDAVDASDDEEDIAAEGAAGVSAAAFRAGITRHAPTVWIRKRRRFKAALFAWRIARCVAEEEVENMRTRGAKGWSAEQATQLDRALAAHDDRLRRAAYHWAESADPSPESDSARVVRGVLRAYAEFVASNPALQKIDRVVVPDTSMRIPMFKALETMLKAVEEP